jgi:glyoxylase-like metal-dependent hydrolase (beta-lactamase superfamily II)
MAGLDVKIDTVLNGRGQIAALFVGDPVDAHTAGIRLAREVYDTQPVEPPDIVVLNAYCKANESVLAIPLLANLLRDRQGDLVLIDSGAGNSFDRLLGNIRSLGFDPERLKQSWSRMLISTTLARCTSFRSHTESR